MPKRHREDNAEMDTTVPIYKVHKFTNISCGQVVSVPGVPYLGISELGISSTGQFHLCGNPIVDGNLCTDISISTYELLAHLMIIEYLYDQCMYMCVIVKSSLNIVSFSLL